MTWETLQEWARRHRVSVKTARREISRRSLGHARIGRRILVSEEHDAEYTRRNERPAIEVRADGTGALRVVAIGPVAK